MPLVRSAEIDFSKLKAPPGHGSVLVEPDPRQWVDAVAKNRRMLDACRRPVAGRTIAEWRSQFRKVAGFGDGVPIIGLGHQPEFIHPGVWAKYVVADRLASRLGGVGLNILVDSDQVHTSSLTVPTLESGRPVVERIPVFDAQSSALFEQVPALTGRRIAELQNRIRSVMGERFECTPMPLFLEQLGRMAGAGDWVEQLAGARRSVEESLGVRVTDRRISFDWCNAVARDMLLRAEQFAASYNGALARYREEHRVRGARRPMPDLEHGVRGTEVALWAFRERGQRRRVFAKSDGHRIRLLADDVVIAELSESEVADGEAANLGERLAPWRIRPRALALTLWARLIASDFFIHGIGGAKYDRISDLIFADYFDIEPPRMGCVSATLFPGLAESRPRDDVLREVKQELRDLDWNPQRHVSDKIGKRNSEIADREQLVAESQRLAREEPENRTRRREIFERIRSLNAALSEMTGDERERLESRLAQVERLQEQSKITRGREFFFALYRTEDLRQMMDALPTINDFGV
ncbi:MAG: hypothetical protein J5J06_01725 [Phycisphaerae bacterium]|nr:hypothetical protein [Phycisphaerae bacterium]